jgi:hypothetical protein
MDKLDFTQDLPYLAEYVTLLKTKSEERHQCEQKSSDAG